MPERNHYTVIVSSVANRPLRELLIELLLQDADNCALSDKGASVHTNDFPGELTVSNPQNP